MLYEKIDVSENESAVALSSDGNKLIVYKNNHHGTGDLYYTLREDSLWSDLVKLPDGINTKYFESGASISHDKKTLFFTSTRPGGLGGEDIYVAYKDTNGIWGNVKNLGPSINTPFDDDTPFIHPDGKTLYFSSKGHQTMGGFDVFKSTFNPQDSSWSTPVNLGFPINTPENDIFFVWSADGQTAYFSTHHEDSYGGEDIYKLEIVDHSHDQHPIILLSGEVRGKGTGNPMGTKIDIYDLSSSKLVGKYHSNSVSGGFSVVLQPNKKYGVLINEEGFLTVYRQLDFIQQDTYHEEEMLVVLETFSEGNKAVLNNVTFDSSNVVLEQTSFFELDVYYQLMLDNPKLVLEIAVHSGQGDDVNQKQANAIFQYLRLKGIPAQRIMARGYGGKYLKTSEIDKDLNRRIELIVHNPNSTKNWRDGYYNISSEKASEKH
ncbi:hypothetical protein OAH12_00150 [Cyclobacteriaceae bacterium]|nr:hypothetical protein [Cyclobacteriaceae bacterium]